MAAEPKLETQPKKGEPVEIAVPKRDTFFSRLKQAAKDAVVRRTSTK